jgi:D-alanyl-D-alanine carboxypeptidase (penicillin-binding protein 5/6)
MRRRMLLAGVLGAASLWSPLVWAAPGPTPVPPIAAPAAIVVDATTGQTLWAKNPDAERPIASVTKLMTLLLAVRAIERGKARWNDLVPVSLAAYRTEGSQIWLEPGEHLPLRQMLIAIAVGSANDASVAVAEYLAGSTEAFVAAMNREAARLGMTHTHFVNPHGLPAVGHYSTAADLARLGMAAVRYPALLRLTSQWEDRTIRNGRGGTLWLINQNRLLRTFPGTDGLKTGYTQAAGFCLVATAVRDGTRLLVVVLGDPSSRQRFDDATALLTWGFQNYRTVTAIAPGQILGRVTVRRGSASSVTAVPLRPVFLTVLREGSERPTVSVSLPTAIGAPVIAGQQLGWATVRLGGRQVARVPLVAARPVAALSFVRLAWRYFWQLVA